MSSEWPVAVLVYRNGLKNPGSPYLAFDEGDRWPNEATNIYFHRDAARAWQAFRDFLNGTPEQWAEREADAYAEGENDGFDRGAAAVHELREGMSLPDLLPPWERGER